MSDATVLPFPPHTDGVVEFPIAVRFGGNVTTGPEAMRLPGVDDAADRALLDVLAASSAEGAVTAVDVRTGATFVHYRLDGGKP